MTRVFWVIAGGWIIGVLGSAPAAFEQMNARGAPLLLPGLGPTASQVILTSLIALVPPLLAATVVRRRRR